MRVAGILLGALLLAAPLGAEEPAYVGGNYEMHGTMTLKASGEKRPIAGSVIFDQRGAEYRSTYHLRTRVQTEDGLRHADVLGRGEGRVEGSRLIGTVETQLIYAQAPGAYGTVPWMPRQFGPVLESASHGSVDEHGVISLVVHYQPVEGGPPNATVVELRGERKRFD